MKIISIGLPIDNTLLERLFKLFNSPSRCKFKKSLKPLKYHKSPMRSMEYIKLISIKSQRCSLFPAKNEKLINPDMKNNETK